MIFIKNIVSEQKENTSLVRLLSSRLAGVEQARTHKIVHVSMLSRDDGFCPREFALMDLTGKSSPNDLISAATRVAFDTGNAVADLVRNKWLVADIVGDWKCLGCGIVYEFQKRPMLPCVKCGRKLWHYKEVSFTDPKTKATGSFDALIDFGVGLHTIIEVKTIDKDEFAELKAPLSEHRVRTQLYLELVRRSESPHAKKINSDRAVVLYISKGFGKKSDVTGSILPFKEYVVEADSATANPIFARGEVLASYRSGGLLPSGICATSFVPRVKTCCVALPCWSGKYPPGVVE